MAKKTNITKTDLVRMHLERGASITPVLALNLYGTFSLKYIISGLRRKGYSIRTEIVKYAPTGSRFARYSLVQRIDERL